MIDLFGRSGRQTWRGVDIWLNLRQRQVNYHILSCHKINVYTCWFRRSAVRLLGDGRADCESIDLRHHSQGGSRISGWQSRPVNLAWSFVCHTREAETVRLSLGGHPTRVPTATSQAWGKRCQWWTPPAHFLCVSALYLGERQQKRMHQTLLRFCSPSIGFATTVPNINGKILLVHLIASGGS